MSQKTEIRAHLERGLSISPRLALHSYGCFRLAARVQDLRAEGMPIQSRLITSAGKRFAVYWLEAGR